MINDLRRSVLYVPGDSVRMLQKAAVVPADLLLLNLEDGVAQSRKAEARKHVRETLRTMHFGDKEVVVRINSLECETGRQDLAEIVPCRPDGICLPKIENAGGIRNQNLDTEYTGKRESGLWLLRPDGRAWRRRAFSGPGKSPAQKPEPALAFAHG